MYNFIEYIVDIVRIYTMCVGAIPAAASFLMPILERNDCNDIERTQMLIKTGAKHPDNLAQLAL